MSLTDVKGYCTAYIEWILCYLEEKDTVYEKKLSDCSKKIIHGIFQKDYLLIKSFFKEQNNVSKTKLGDTIICKSLHISLLRDLLHEELLPIFNIRTQMDII